MRYNRFVRSLSILMLAASYTVNAQPTPALTQPMRDYIADVSKQYHFDESSLTTLLKSAHINQDIIDRMNRPYEAKPWGFYQKLFVDPKRVSDGVDFWLKHQKELAQAEAKYGVPASIIVAIIGVETRYGQHTGDFSVLDALTTLAFNYPSREKLFRYELTEFLLLTREQKIDPYKLTGSYAGATGYPQFMPSAYRRFAVSCAGQGRADITNSPCDAIHSVGNFLDKKGWTPNQPIALPLKVNHPVQASLLSAAGKPEHTLQFLQSKSIPIPRQVDKNVQAAIVKLPTEESHSEEYWLTFNNFRTLMRYNTNFNYAMAVHQLSEEIKHAYQQSIAARTKASSARTA